MVQCGCPAGPLSDFCRLPRLPYLLCLTPHTPASGSSGSNGSSVSSGASGASRANGASGGFQFMFPVGARNVMVLKKTMDYHRTMDLIHPITMYRF